MGMASWSKEGKGWGVKVCFATATGNWALSGGSIRGEAYLARRSMSGISNAEKS